MKTQPSRSGFILPLAIVLIAVAGIVTAAVASYAAYGVRMTRLYRGRTDCRFAAQSAIEDAKARIYTEFLAYAHTEEGRIGLLSSKSSSFVKWFSPVADRQVGTVTLPASTNINGCLVKVRATDAASGQKRSAVFALVATAWLLNDDGTPSGSINATIKETLRYGVGRSKVFDHAYFVNNYGWFQGTGCTANGDVRANGNMYLDSGCCVNGKVFAAKNDELGVRGNIENYGVMLSRSQYWSQVSSSARPTSPTHTGGTEWSGGYEAPVTADAAQYRARLHGNLNEGLTMPYISDLEPYIEYAEEEGGTLKQNGVTLINAHFSGTGPSGNPELADKGAIILEGTLQSPLVINGPVVVDSDVIIKGYVTGQGTIYSGRNIHIVGNIQYVNPPSWPHPDSNPSATAAQNERADLFGLMAKGNIVLGDCTGEPVSVVGKSNASSWHNSVDAYLYSRPYVQPYECDASDVDIGYRNDSGEAYFGGDYTALDGGNKVERRTETVTEELSTGHYEYKTTYVNGRPRQTRVWIPDTRTYTVTVDEDKPTRRFYDTVILDSELSSRCSTITRVDAVLYNNHGIFGKIGNCVFNGALVCRNEGLIYNQKLNINWDIRLDSGSAEGAGNQSGMAMDASAPCTLAWEEVPISSNPAAATP